MITPLNVLLAIVIGGLLGTVTSLVVHYLRDKNNKK